LNSRHEALHEVYVTKDLGSERNEDLIAFINKHIMEFEGGTEERHEIPQMLFEEKLDAQRFAKELSLRFNIQKEHITVKVNQNPKNI
jgi:hypothetical protein